MIIIITIVMKQTIIIIVLHGIKHGILHETKTSENSPHSFNHFP